MPRMKTEAPATPLSRAVTTLEGQLVVASNVVLTVGAVDGLIPAKYAGIVVVAQNIALIVQRTVLKLQHSKAVTAVLESPNPLETAIDELGLTVDPSDEPDPVAADEPARLADQL